MTGPHLIAQILTPGCSFISSCRMLGASSGGVTHFCFCPTDDDEGVMTIGVYLRVWTIGFEHYLPGVCSAWGQSANNYELGLGDGQPKSATKPVEVTPLTGINVFGCVIYRPRSLGISYILVLCIPLGLRLARTLRSSSPPQTRS